MDRAERTPLHHAALENDAALVGDLIGGGADVNAADTAGYTPLHFAAQQGSIEAATLLLEAGAEVDARDGAGTTPLLRAVLSGTRAGDMILLLRRHGADPLASDDRGGTPVGWARQIANYDLAQYFTDVPDSPQIAVDADAQEPAQHAPHWPPADHARETGWRAEFARLWKELVPPRGQARTVQGELIRCVGRLTDEAYRNGNQNWSAGHDRMLGFVAATLFGDCTFDSERQAALRADLAEVGDFAHPNTGGNGTCYYNLAEAAVDWCRLHEAVIPREVDPDLSV